MYSTSHSPISFVPYFSPYLCKKQKHKRKYHIYKNYRAKHDEHRNEHTLYSVGVRLPALARACAIADGCLLWGGFARLFFAKHTIKLVNDIIVCIYVFVYFFDILKSVNDVVNEFVWVKVGLLLLIGTGILMTILTNFFQITHLRHWVKKTMGGIFKKDAHNKKEAGSVSQFQAMCTALAATIGTGNIAGVSAAIVLGGPGAVFWMWIAAFFGMMTNFSENVLGIYYRKRNKDGEWSGGAMYYLKEGLAKKPGYEWIGKTLAVLFSLFAIFASFGIGNMGQVNKITLNLNSAFFSQYEELKILGFIPLTSFFIGLGLLIISALIILGGLKRIAAVAEKDMHHQR